MLTRRWIRAGAATAALAATTALLAASASGQRAQATAANLDPRSFVRVIDNPYFPLIPGSRWVYAGVKDGASMRDVVVATHRTKTILGVRCTAVSDVSSHDGKVLERTTDWYAQDRAGNVWYFGEDTAAYENGQVDRSGSWLAGVKGARQGIMMTAHPKVGDAHRQEYWRGQAEDQYWLVDTNAHVRVPFGTFDHALLTFEWSRIEPNVIDNKNYVRGIGEVREVAVKGPTEYANLVSFTRGG